MPLRFEVNADTVERLALRPNSCVIRCSHVKDEAHRKALRGRWCKISSDNGSTCRVLRFGGGDLASDRIMIDWDAWLDVSDAGRDKCVEIRFELLPWWQLPFAPLCQSDPTDHLAYMLGLIGFGVGLIALVLGVFSFLISLGLL